RATRASRMVLPRARWNRGRAKGERSSMSGFLLPRLPGPARAGDELFEPAQLLGAGVLGLEEAGDELVEGAVEDLVQEAGGDALPAVARGVDEGAPLGAVLDQPLLLHVAEHRLHGVERQLPAGAHLLVDLADAAGAKLPQ